MLEDEDVPVPLAIKVLRARHRGRGRLRGRGKSRVKPVQVSDTLVNSANDFIFDGRPPEPPLEAPEFYDDGSADAREAEVAEQVGPLPEVLKHLESAASSLAGLVDDDHALDAIGAVDEAIDAVKNLIRDRTSKVDRDKDEADLDRAIEREAAREL